MVLSLITPAASNFLKNWPAQNAVNCDLIDDYAGPCLTSDSLNTYVPVLSATTTAPSLGAGFIRGFYYRIFDQIYTWGEFRFGTGFSTGSGTYTISLPFPAESLLGPNDTAGLGPIIGSALLWDDSTDAGRQPLEVQLRTNQLLMFDVRAGLTDRAVSGTVPITWASPDGISWAARYKRQA